MEERKMIEKVWKILDFITFSKIGKVILTSISIFTHLYVFYAAILAAINPELNILVKSLFIILYGISLHYTIEYFKSFKELKLIEKEIKNVN